MLLWEWLLKRPLLVHASLISRLLAAVGSCQLILGASHHGESHHGKSVPYPVAFLVYQCASPLCWLAGSAASCMQQAYRESPNSVLVQSISQSMCLSLCRAGSVAGCAQQAYRGSPNSVLFQITLLTMCLSWCRAGCAAGCAQAAAGRPRGAQVAGGVAGSRPL
jgi:hypothetical protein